MMLIAQSLRTRNSIAALARSKPRELNPDAEPKSARIRHASVDRLDGLQYGSSQFCAGARHDHRPRTLGNCRFAESIFKDRKRAARGNYGARKRQRCNCNMVGLFESAHGLGSAEGYGLVRKCREFLQAGKERVMTQVVFSRVKITTHIVSKGATLHTYLVRASRRNHVTSEPLWVRYSIKSMAVFYMRYPCRGIFCAHHKSMYYYYISM